MQLFFSFVFILELVSPSIIRNRRNVLLERTHQGQQESQTGTKVPEMKSYRVKREVRESNEWEKICKTEAEIVPLVPAIDNEGNQILQLAVAGTVDYQEFVKVERCRDTVAHVGGVSVQCEQEYLEHNLIVFDPDTGQEKIHRPFFYPSGCSAKILKPR